MSHFISKVYKKSRKGMISVVNFYNPGVQLEEEHRIVTVRMGTGKVCLNPPVVRSMPCHCNIVSVSPGIAFSE